MRPSIEKDCKKYGSVKLKKKPRKECLSETEAPYDNSLDSSKVNGKVALTTNNYLITLRSYAMEGT